MDKSVAQLVQDIISTSSLDAASEINDWLIDLLYSKSYRDNILEPTDVQLMLAIVVNADDETGQGGVYVHYIADTVNDTNNVQDLTKSKTGIYVRPLASVRSFYKPKVGDIIPVFILGNMYRGFYLPAAPPAEYYSKIGLEPNDNDILLVDFTDNVKTYFIYDRQNHKYNIKFNIDSNVEVTITGSMVTMKKTGVVEKVAKSASLAREINNALQYQVAAVFNTHMHTCILTGAPCPPPVVQMQPNVTAKNFESNVLEVT